ncbi:MAG: hypothetical protein JWO66_785, partial [Candidatus Eremiobacteraeota bacterium]|nr:hypothetical protein [Candidatus Eremiobacteraeota bacterium]
AAPDEQADIDLFVRVPATSASDEARFVDEIARDVDVRSKSSQLAPLAAIADLTFLATNDYAQQRQLTDELIARGIAGQVASFASWNTVANTVGTALPEAIAVMAGRLFATYDRRAHATFTLMRYVDDVAFHTIVRPELNADLTAQGVADHTLLAPDVARQTASANRALLWPAGLDLLARIEPQFRDRGFTITLPWDRTFETELELRLHRVPDAAR